MKSAFSRARRHLSLGVLALLVCAPLLTTASDVRLYVVVKGQSLIQFNAGAPVLQAGTPYLFIAFADLAAGGALTGATVQALPGGAVQTLNPEAASFSFEDAFTSLSTLNAAYPNGDFRLVMDAVHDGQKSVTLRVSGDAYPSHPRISNFDAAQAVDPSKAFTLRWDAFTGGTASDFIQLALQDDTGREAFRTPDAGLAGALTGQATSVLIPAFALPPGKNFTGRLRFVRIQRLDTTTYPSATGASGYFKETEFTFATIPGGPDTLPPTLLSSNPANGETGVPVTRAVSFTFTELMEPFHSILWSGNVNPDSFAYIWNGDARTLVCLYNGNLPANATITWALNPPGSPNNFRDLAGNPLATVSGSFKTGSTRSADVSIFGAVKGQAFEQSGAGLPQLRTGTPFQFRAFVELTAPASVTTARVTLPGGSSKTLVPKTESLEFGENLSSQVALDSAYPNGRFTLTLETVRDGTVTSALDLTGNAYPNAPHVSNYTAAQTIDATDDFTLTWDAFAGGGLNDVIQVRIEDAGQTVFETSARPDEQDGLDGLATSVVIPARTLIAGKTYSATLLFAKATDVDFTTYAGVIGFAGYFKSTRFSLKTAGAASADVTLYVLNKQQTFMQTSNEAPALDTSPPFRFNAVVTAAATGAVTAAAVRLPTGAVRNLTASADTLQFSFGESFGSAALLDLAYPASIYTLIVNTAHDGTKSLPLEVPAVTYPNAPRVSFFLSTQAIDAAADFTLEWAPFLGATGGDNVMFTIHDTQGALIYQAPGPDQSGMLPGTATSTVIPANTLAPGKSCEARLQFGKRVTLDTATYPGARGGVVFRSRTRFNLATTVPVPPRLQVLPRTIAGEFQLRLTGEPNRTYLIEGSLTLAPGSWTTLVSLPAVGGTFIFRDDESQGLPRRFYRARRAD
ncbi:MAG: Ig-like domain-containing protein [Verrucomicrobia bacterium]|nr:Ig-like domain-containing protein [Verrucomicrobiota bacterium]